MTTTIDPLTAEQRDALEQIRDGGDVTSPALARTLRAIEREHPDLITIGKVKGDYDGAGQLPFFGAIATMKGRQLLDAA